MPAFKLDKILIVHKSVYRLMNGALCVSTWRIS